MVQISSFQIRLITQCLKCIAVVLIILHSGFPASSQDIYISGQPVFNSNAEQRPLSTQGRSKKRCWRATGEWSMMQLLPWASNLFIRKAAFAKISFESIAANRVPANMEWDDNKFFNNQFSHPYQGSLYFNACRGNGFNFWQSIPAAFTGSLAWETIMETHYPAPNDLINTSLGGIAFGEMSHRMSAKLAGGKWGCRRRIAAPLLFAINPVGAVENIFVQNRANSCDDGYADTPPVSITATAGMREINIKGPFKSGGYKSTAFGCIRLHYGNSFADCNRPFSTFSLIVEGGGDDSGKVNTLQIEGSLWGRAVQKNSHATYSYSVSMKYDFFKNEAFVYGAQSFSTNFLAAFHISDKLQVQVKGEAGIIPLAAVPNPYMYYGEGRNYDYCIGADLGAGLGISLFNRLFYNFNITAAGLKTVDGYKSTHVFSSTGSTLRLVVYKNVSIEAVADSYYFGGHYDKYPEAASRYQFLHFGIGYKTVF